MARPQLGEGLAEVESSPLVASDDRRYVQAQAFTLFARVYDEARRGVTYLRWRERDVQRFVPTLYPQRPRSGGAVEEEDEVGTDLEDEVQGEVEAEAPAEAVVGDEAIAAEA